MCRVSRRAGRRTLLERLLTVVLVVGPVALIALWLAFQHKPGWYRPSTLDQAGIQRARSEAVAVADDVSDQMVERQPFEVVLHDRVVNEWLAALPHIWPDLRDALPPQISEPAVRFDGGDVRVGAHYVGSGWQAIVNGGLSLKVSDDGTDLLVAVRTVRGGSLPIPRGILTSLLEQLLPWRRSIRDAADIGDETLLTALQKIESVDELFEGVRIENRFVWFNGRRPFRIASIQADDGKLRLRIEPL